MRMDITNIVLEMNPKGSTVIHISLASKKCYDLKTKLLSLRLQPNIRGYFWDQRLRAIYM